MGLEKLIEVDNLSFGYDSDVNVIDGISFSIDVPGFYCIIGPNGVGKSTLVKCICGHIKPTSGDVKICGRPVRDYKLVELAKLVGYVPVVTSDFNVMTVLDTVLIGRYAQHKWRTTSEDVDVAHKALEAMEMGEYSTRNFNELSAGQHQKVALARGLVQEPKILVLDEPTSNLDVRHQLYVSAFLKKLADRSGITILMISHDLNLSSKFADQVIVMSKPGVLYSMGPPKDVITEDMISNVYGVNCKIIDDNGKPHVVLQL